MKEKSIHIDENQVGQPLKDVLGEIPRGIIGAEGPDRIYGFEDPVQSAGDYKLFDMNAPQAMKLFWHSAAHLLAQAVLNLYPNAKLGIGPAIKDGYYYDFDFGESFSADDLEKVEAEMKRNMEADLPIVRRSLSREEANDFFKERNQDYKLDLIEDLEGDISTYSQGEFTDLCRGPHMPSTGFLKNFKLTAVTGAYWRGDERNPMLQRIYGTAYPTPKLLKAHLKRLEEAKKRDHRLIGKQMELFSFFPEAPGAPFWHPKGSIVLNEIKNYIKDLLVRRGYGFVNTPLIMTRDLWERSGHWDHYQNNMYFTSIDERDFAVKPMNCPGAVLMYNSRQWSYRDLPQRWAELGIVHRFEKSGTLHGLFRVRHITQDDAHIFCTVDQLQSEVKKMIDLVFEVFNHFGLTEISMELSTRPKDRIGAEENWDRAEEALEQVLNDLGKGWELNAGDGAFYGPKIDFHVSDSLGRSWQLSTIQVDFNFPERFDMEYVGSDNETHRPVMLHRAIFGSLERFLGILIEHYAGDFPLWLAPEQAVILPIAEDQHEAANRLKEKLLDNRIRCRVDDRNEKIGKKIREAEKGKIPYMLVIGQKEADAEQVSLRRRKKGDLGVVAIDDLIARMVDEIKEAN